MTKAHRLFAVICAVAIWCQPAASQQTPAELAAMAADRLDAAQAGLEAASGARDRVDALTRTIRAYEDGLNAMRQGLRQAALRERAIAAEFDATSGELSKVIAVLMNIQNAQGPLGVIHPSGPLGTARSGMIVADVTPALQGRVDALKAKLGELATIRALQEGAADQLQLGLQGAQTARAELSKAIANRTDLPLRFTSDEQAMANLANSAVDLQDFATGLLDMDLGPDSDDPVKPFRDAKGELPLPTLGRVLRRFDEPDAAGIKRPGLILSAQAGGLVTAPWPSTIRYAGPLLDYGNVMILEPEAGILMVLAGMEALFGQVGQVVQPGAALGLMGGEVPNADTFLLNAESGAGSTQSESLYIEIRDGTTPTDPAPWFAATKES